MQETTRIELNLPSDVVAVIQTGERTDLEERVKTSLAIGLFAERVISLAKAARLAGLTRYEFALLLKQSGLPAYEYTSTDFDEDKALIKSIKE